MRLTCRADANQRAIVRALRAAGATVEHLHRVGHGCPDLLVGFRGRTFAFEVKAGDGQLTPDEMAWHENWRGQVAIVRSEDEALAAIGTI